MLNMLPDLETPKHALKKNHIPGYSREEYKEIQGPGFTQKVFNILKSIRARIQRFLRQLITQRVNQQFFPPLPKNTNLQ